MTPAEKATLARKVLAQYAAPGAEFEILVAMAQADAIFVVLRQTSVVVLDVDAGIRAGLLRDVF